MLSHYTYSKCRQAGRHLLLPLGVKEEALPYSSTDKSRRQNNYCNTNPHVETISYGNKQIIQTGNELLMLDKSITHVHPAPKDSRKKGC